MTKKSTSSLKEEALAAAQPAAGTPLFFKNPRMIDLSHHAKAAVASGAANYDFTLETNSVPLSTIEFIEAYKNYPIVFSMEEVPTPVAIVGLEKNNYFVQLDGTWKTGCYIPAYIRQYPFVFFEHTETKKFYLCIDESSPLYRPTAEKGANALYKENGEPTEFTNHALQYCTAFYNHSQITKNFAADLKKHTLLAPYHSQLQLKSGRKINLSGFQMIDEKALGALSDEVFLEFRKKGWLPFIYLSLTSASNWKFLADAATAGEMSA